MPLQALSLGREVDVWRPRTGAVHSVFVRAVNLLVDGELWTVLGVERPDSPFGIRVATHDGGFDVKVAERVNIRAGFVSVGKLILDCRAASRWSPARWSQPALGLEARLSTVEQKARPRAWAESARMAGEVTNALHGSDAELAAAVRRVVGRGPGLTPSGDDVLAGILAVLTSGTAGLTGVRAASRLVHAFVPLLPSTSDVSRHLLHQAARGLSGRALHDFGHALMEGASSEVLADALNLVLETGSTSGADACLGLVAACRFSFTTAESFTA